MYIKDKLLKFLKIVSMIIVVIAVFRLSVSVFYIGDMVCYYGSDIKTITGAVDFASSIRSFILVPIILYALKILNEGIKDTYLYNSYFEGDLNGVVSLEDLSNITGDSQKKVFRKIIIYRKLFMKNFEIKIGRDKHQILLNSKKIQGKCLNCGAQIEKSEIFVGNCPYCDNPDISVKVLSANRFYTINYDGEKLKDAKYFLTKKYKLKQFMYLICCGISALFIMILFIMFIDYFIKVNDKDYLKRVLMEGETMLCSYELIKMNMISQLIFNAVFIMFFLVVLIICVKKASLLAISQACAGTFASTKRPFLTIHGTFKNVIYGTKNHKKRLKKLKKAIGFSYLKNCSFEKHEGKLYVTLGRKIVRDKCPNCRAPIKDPVYENYVCRYCGTEIMGVVKKR